MDHYRITTNLLRKLQQLISKKLLEGTNIRVDEREREGEREREQIGGEEVERDCRADAGCWMNLPEAHP